MSVTRLLRPDDAQALAALVRANRQFLAPWEPLRSEEHFTDDGQSDVVRRALLDHGAGGSVPRVILDEHARVVGMVTLQSIIRGAFQSCSVGYWLSEHAQGRGVATAALREATQVAFDDLGLHRVQAETLVHNDRSQRVLARVGFVQYGLAPAYLKIAGRWQDNLLYQLLNPLPGPDGPDGADGPGPGRG